MKVWQTVLISICILTSGLLIFYGLIRLSNSHRYQAVQRESNVIFVIDTNTGKTFELSPGQGWIEGRLPDDTP
jgi:hypothetical protein